MKRTHAIFTDFRKNSIFKPSLSSSSAQSVFDETHCQSIPTTYTIILK